MAKSQIEPGVPITLQELYPSSLFYKEGVSLRVTAMLRGYSVETAIGVIEDGGRSLKINTQNIRDVSFRVGSIYQFIGELHIEQPNNEVSCLQSLDKTRSFLPNGKSLKLKNIALLERFLDPYNV
jgi:hypothetical protein